MLKSNLFMPVWAFWYFRSRNKNDAIFKLYIRDVTLLGIVSVQHVQRISNYWMRGYSIIWKYNERVLTLEHTYVCFVILSTLSWACGLRQHDIHRKHFSKSDFGFGNGMNFAPISFSGYLLSDLHVPYEQCFTIIFNSIEK